MFESHIQLPTDIVDVLSTRRSVGRSRHNRKTHYRKKRGLITVSTEKAGGRHLPRTK